jgi:TolA-binding protein
MFSSTAPPLRTSSFWIPQAILVGLAFVLAGLLSAPQSSAQGTMEGRLQITARVTDQQTGEQLEQVRLELVVFPSGVIQVGFTDGTGRYQFGGVTIQMYHLRGTKMGYEPAEVRVDPGASPRAGNMTMTVDVPLRRKDVPSNAPGAPVSARELSLPAGAVNEFHAGIDLLSAKKDPKASIEHFQKAIDAYPGYYEAYFLMGMANMQSGNTQASETPFRKAIALNEKFFEPYYPLSAVLHSLGRDEDAFAVLEKARGLDPSGWRWPFEMARLYGNRLEFSTALPLAQEASSKKDVPARVHLLLADLYSNSRQPQKALEELQAFAKLEPASPLLPKVQTAIARLQHLN